jgi:hypothetical protein
MKTTQPITPEQIGLSLSVISGPVGSVREDWPCISYRVAIHDSRRREIWSGEYHLGIGHVDFKQARHLYFTAGYGKSRQEMAGWDVPMLNAIAAGKTPLDKQAAAKLAASVANVQGVTPKLNDVMHGVISDGSVFFDGLTFEDWAADLGCDTDSRKAEAIFRACDETGRTLARNLSRDDLDGLREWASNY